jgi:putative heme iron utilization protein
MNESDVARRLLLEQSFGVLSTISLDVPGYPFGSVAPYSVDQQCRPVIYISTIAQHTRNILADARVSLTVFDSSGGSDDVQARSRLTYIADARPVPKEEGDVQDRYFRYFPSSRQYEQTHDFAFFRLEPVRLRFIGGFGRIYWLEASQFMAANPFSPSQESRIIQHMNRDHSDAIKHYTGGDSAEMVGIDDQGFDVLKQSGSKVRFFFERPVQNMEEARQALIAMAKRPA